MRIAFLIAVLLVAMPLAACGVLLDVEEARICRSILPAVAPPGSAIRIVSVQQLGRDRGVKIFYRAEETGADAYVRTLSCSFDPDYRGTAEPRHVDRVEVDGIALGPLRLHVLVREWLEKAGPGADPSPIANAEFVPQIPRWAATSLQSVTAALPQMAIYALLAVAYALVYGLVGRINLAFGDFATLGGYGALLGMIGAGGSQALLPGIIAGLVFAAWAAACHGALIGRFIFAPLARQRGQVVLIASTGLALSIAEYIRLAQGSGMRWSPPIFNVPVGLARSGDYVVTATPMALAVTLVALMAAGALMTMMRRSRFGRAWRACADDPLAAALMGLSPPRTLLLTFILASLMAGLGGAITTFYYGGAAHSGGLLVGLKALIAAILGGIGSVPGAFLGGLLLGAAEALWSSLFPIELRDPVIYALLAIVLVIKPGGLRGLPELEPRAN